MVQIMKRKKGFTLIELMIVVAIIAILVSIAIPNYQQYIIRSNRSAVQAFMVNVDNREKQYLLDARAYTGNLGTLGMTVPGDVSKNYNVTVEVTTGPPGFIITAAPKAGTSQLSDGNLTLNNLGAKAPANKW